MEDSVDKGRAAAPVMHVAFLDVGHGCCTVIVTPHAHRVVMVDCKFGAGPCALDYLRENGLNYPCAFFISHLHDDHVAGFADVFRQLVKSNVFADRVYCNCVGPTTHKRSARGGQAVMDQMSDLVDGDQDRLPDFRSTEPPWTLDGVTFSILHPDKDALLRHHDREDMLNDLSGVLRVDFGRVSVLLPGDVQGWGAARLLGTAGKSVACNLLLYPHHGAHWEHLSPADEPVVRHHQAMISPLAFLRAVGPTWTVLSVGSTNDGNWEQWQHPSPQVLNMLREWHAQPDGGFLCTEVTPHCESPLPPDVPRVPCAGHIVFQLHGEGGIHLVEPTRCGLAATIRGWRHPRCLRDGG